MSIGKAAAVVGAGVLGSRILGLVRDIVLAGVLGDTVRGDLFQAAFFLPDLLFYLVAGGFLSITFIPILSSHFADDDEAGAWAAFVAVARPLALLMAVLTVVAMVFAEGLVELLFVDLAGLFGLDTADNLLVGAARDDLVRLTRIVLPAQFFFMLGSLLMGVQYARNRFALPALAPIIYNLGIIVGGLIGFAVSDGDPTPDGFVWGALAGAVLGNFALQAVGARRVGLRLPRGVPLRHPAVGEYALMAVPLMVGQSFAVLDEQLIRIFGAYAEEGAVTALALARKVNMVPVGLVAQAAGIAAYPTLARLHAEGRTAQMRATAAGTLRMAFFVGGLATAAVLATSVEALRVLFERGAWTEASTQRAASALIVFSFSIPFWAAHQLLSRSLYAQRRMWAPVLIGTAATAIALPIYPWAVDQGGGGAQLAIASTAGIVITTVGLAAWWFRGHGEELGPVLGTMLRVVPAVALAGFGGRAVTNLIPAAGAGGGFLPSLLAVAVGGLVAAVIYAVVSRVVASRELAALATRLPAPWDERIGGRRP